MLFEVDEAATRIREEVDNDANVIVGATFDESLQGIVRVSVVATGIDNLGETRQTQPTGSLTELASRLRKENHRSAERIESSAPRPELYSRFSAVRNSIEQVVCDIPAFLGRKAN